MANQTQDNTRNYVDHKWADATDRYKLPAVEHSGTASFRLLRPAETKTFASGSTLVELQVAQGRNVKINNEWGTLSSNVTIKLWGDDARRIMANNPSVGDRIVVSGNYRTLSELWTRKDGTAGLSQLLETGQAGTYTVTVDKSRSVPASQASRQSSAPVSQPATVTIETNPAIAAILQTS